MYLGFLNIADSNKSISGDQVRVRRKGDAACRRPEESCSTKDLLQPEEGTEAGRGPFSACQPRVWTLTRYLKLVLFISFIMAYVGTRGGSKVILI